MKNICYVRSFGYAVFLGMMSYSMVTSAGLYKIRLNNIVSNGAGYCEDFFDINTANMYTINNINIKVGGNTTIDDPGYWQLFSPVDFNMTLTIFGFNVTTVTHKYYEYNTSYHNGPLDTGQWHLLFQEPIGGCSQFKALLTYDATP